MARSSFRCVTFHFGRSCEMPTKVKTHCERIFLHCNLIQPVHSATESVGIGNNTIALWLQCNVHILCMYLGFQTQIDSVWLVVSHHYYPFTMYRKIDGNESHCFIWLCYYWSDSGTEWIFWRKKKPYSFRKVSLDSKKFNFWWRIWNLHNSLFFLLWKRTFT